MNPELLDARERLGFVIRASEDWEDVYRHDEAAFKRLVAAERFLERQALVYLSGLAERAIALVQWYNVPLHASATDYIDPNDPRIQEEKIAFFREMYDGVASAVLLGALSGETAYGIEMGISTSTDFVLTAAKNHTGMLIKDITDTNLKLIRNSITVSIASGEDSTAAIARIQNIIKNPVRAEMIARTETVNAYQVGLEQFAFQTQAVSKTWQAVQSGACRICAPLNDVTVAIDESFVTLIGPKIRPTAHPRCRCGLRYNYK